MAGERKLPRVPARIDSRKLLVNASAVSQRTFSPGRLMPEPAGHPLQQVRLPQPHAAVNQ